jgi:hypothetical protein
LSPQKGQLQSPNAMSMVCERGWGEGKRRILIGQSVPPTPFGMAFGRLKLSPQYLIKAALMTTVLESLVVTQGLKSWLT